jgi:hypothetical protein
MQEEKELARQDNARVGAETLKPASGINPTAVYAIFPSLECGVTTLKRPLAILAPFSRAAAGRDGSETVSHAPIDAMVQLCRMWAVADAGQR